MLQLQVLEAKSPSDFAAAFSTVAKERAVALLVLGDPMFFDERGRIVELAAKNRLPAVAGQREYAEAGSLMAYGADLRDNFRRAAVYGPGVRAAKEATTTIPIVMTGASDPVAAGLVASLAHPGGNVTGVADYQVDLIPKRLELMKAAVPSVRRVVNIFGNFGGFDAAKLAALDREQDAAAQALGVTLARVQMNTPEEFGQATRAVLSERPDALLLSPNPTNFLMRRDWAEFVQKQRLPSMAGSREHVLAGIMMSYGVDFADILRTLARFVDQILKGANPGDLPVEQPTKFELVINLKAAKALGITIPQSLLLRADEVIQ
jgi:putative ABC transport system substrate-binding protein